MRLGTFFGLQHVHRTHNIRATKKNFWRHPVPVLSSYWKPMKCHLFCHLIKGCSTNLCQCALMRMIQAYLGTPLCCSLEEGDGTVSAQPSVLVVNVLVHYTSLVLPSCKTQRCFCLCLRLAVLAFVELQTLPHIPTPQRLITERWETHVVEVCPTNLCQVSWHVCGFLFEVRRIRRGKDVVWFQARQSPCSLQGTQSTDA